MRRKKDSTQEEDPELLRHVRGLGLETVHEYREWCRQNGFSTKLKKDWKQRCRENFVLREAEAEQRRNRQKREKRDLLGVISDICHRRIRSEDVTQPHLKRLCIALQTKRSIAVHERKASFPALKRLLTHPYIRRAKFFDGSPALSSLGIAPGNTFLEALALIAVYADSWVRPLEDWKPRSRSTRKQFTSLLHHLFVSYDMPAFFDSVWFAPRNKKFAEYRTWYLSVGKGQNIRRCELPIPFTKKMAHHFMQAPANTTVPEAILWGQVHALGGDEHLARAIFGTRISDGFEHNDFWSTVMTWFIERPMLDRAHVGPIVDYLHHQRFVPEHVFVIDGNREETAPSRPNLTMKGRTSEALLREVNRWHGKLANDNTHQISEWQRSGIDEFEFTEGSQKGDNLRHWQIRELLSSKSLIAEGRALRHCVASYAASCLSGRCSIWTMEVDSFKGRQKLLTIEIRSGAQAICQIRGMNNRLPTEKEISIIRRWAEQAGLVLP